MHWYNTWYNKYWWVGQTGIRWFNCPSIIKMAAVDVEVSRNDNGEEREEDLW